VKLLGFSTYPVTAPKHGGQRRIRALGELYQRLGGTYEVAAVYQASQAHEAGPNDIPLGHSSPEWAGLPFTEDLQAGEFAARSPAAYAHFRRIYDRVQPDIIVLEQPFMLPLVQKMQTEGLTKARIIYSSQNWEGPLKEAVLLKAGVSAKVTQKIAASVERIELEALAAANLVLCVSQHDADIYRARSTAPVLVAPNGVDRAVSLDQSPHPVLGHFGGRKFIFYVGSAYPPNIEGFNKLVSDDGLFFVPPLKAFAICGGMCDQIFNSRSYQQFVSANSERVQFFPQIEDDVLVALKAATHAIILPIQFGGGSNLKTAEALVAGKWIVTTSLALRGFEPFANAKGVVIADSPREFRLAISKVLSEPPLQLTSQQLKAREDLYWDRAFILSGAEEGVRTFLGAAHQGAVVPDVVVA
jgi:glycosyltransferase involved in cell wall biosynthesis